tara:strand:- start:7296 stop:7772 length:477 start_codon:yes stop_codon:yes gene_type:complete
MNIFVLDKDPQIAATMACDKHVIKMILETAQMLCAVAIAKGHEMPYRATHKHHPCTLWAGHSRGNWNWLVEHGVALCEEYTKRYGKVHKSQRVIEHAIDINIMFDKQELTPFAQAMPEQYKNDCVVTAYRAYYMGEKARFATWKTKTPDWWNAGVAQR